jgi:hypothetical protein
MPFLVLPVLPALLSLQCLRVHVSKLKFTMQLQEVPTSCIYTCFLDTIYSVADPDLDPDKHRSA